MADEWMGRWRSAGGAIYRERDGSARFAVLNHMDDCADMRRSRRAILISMLSELTANQRAAVLTSFEEPPDAR